jgi:hypothetical protein
MGGSIQGAGKKGAYLIQLPFQITMLKKRIYFYIWCRADTI